MTIVYSGDKTIALTEHLITDGLGYCCLFAFFSIYRRTSMIALRLGVTPRTIRLYKARFRDGEYKCAGCERCLASKIRDANDR